MKYVLDSSVALKWVLPEQDSATANRLRADFHSGLHELLAPDIFPVEIGHALSKAERRKAIAPAQGWVFWQSIMADCPAYPVDRPYAPGLRHFVADADWRL